jgi:pyrroline-5-carboxylate reductase
VEKEIFKVDDLILTQRKPSPMLIEEGFNVTSSNKKAVEESQWVLLCVQPYQLDTVVKDVYDVISNDHLFISTLTGVSTDSLSAKLPVGTSVCRAMPNTASAVASSMTCLAIDDSLNHHLSFVEKIFESIGETMRVDEELMQAATVLGASGIAFFMRYLRAATQAGVQMGFDSGDAQRIAVQTAKGAALLIQQKKTHPEVEIDKVTTPKGCTIQGLNEMEHQGFSSALIKGVMTSFEKINEIKSDLGAKTT